MLGEMQPIESLTWRLACTNFGRGCTGKGRGRLFQQCGKTTQSMRARDSMRTKTSSLILSTQQGADNCMKKTRRAVGVTVLRDLCAYHGSLMTQTVYEGMLALNKELVRFEDFLVK